MNLKLAIAASLMTLSVPLDTIAAQQVSPAGIAAGDRVRFTIVGEKRQKLAKVVAATDEQLRVEFLGEEGVGEVRLADLRSLDRSLGRRSAGQSAARGAMWGLVTGGILTAVVAASTSIACRQSSCDGFGGIYVAFAAVTFPIAGLTIGGLLGAAAPGERWQPVPVR